VPTYYIVPLLTPLAWLVVRQAWVLANSL
jgi:hypothetical protein